MALKKNILYSGLMTTSLYIFQFITYPYVARVLGVENIGICNFVQSILQYYTLFTAFGISTLGVREIAKCNGDKTKLNATFSRLFTLNAIFTLSVLVIFFLSIELIPSFQPYKELLYIGSFQILFGLFMVEWLFRGIEDFKYITIRSLFIRVGYVTAIFLFVHDRTDYITYFIISVGMIVANGIVNWIYAKRYVHYSIQPLNNLKGYIKPLIFLGSQTLLTSVYTTFNVVYLGLVCGDLQVGYYTTATKIEGIIISFYSSFTLVLMPRISALLASEEKEKVNLMLQKSIGLLFTFVFPCIIFSVFYAKDIIYLVAGSGYEGAIVPMQIVMLAMLIVGIEQILIVQLLLPGKNDKDVFTYSIMGALTSLLLNILLVPRLQSVGSAFVWLISELIVMICAVRCVKRKHSYITFHNQILSHLLYFIPLAIGLFCITRYVLSTYSSFIIGCITTIIYSHFALKYLIKNQVYTQVIQTLKLHKV